MDFSKIKSPRNCDESDKTESPRGDLGDQSVDSELNEDELQYDPRAIGERIGKAVLEKLSS